MNPAIRIAICVLATIALSSCVPPMAYRQQSIGMAVSPGQLLAGRLLNIRAPNSQGWQLVESKNGDVEFGKHGLAANETYAAQVLAFNPPKSEGPEEFTDFVKGVAKGMNPERFDVYR